MLYTAIAGLALAATAAAAPSTEIEKRAGGGNQNISIYRYGDAKQCHHILRDAGACGISTYFKNVNQEASFVAMPATIFDKYGSAQHNKLCGKTVTIKHNGVTKTAIVADRNLSNDHSIDTCLDIWKAFGGKDNDGTLIRGATWSVNGV
ncbi:hypothetical protein NLG97_g1553 [Lecanicillium saksenae]|uniref:Uncharacterized protein n=1 Tax=Lecanicillium saksenae TaxID=468837 RepID=A0ACC1R430_9HYPO|nr:hypothetical protein NLG97_g1553 [Lecanicillium saksenae]